MSINTQSINFHKNSSNDQLSLGFYLYILQESRMLATSFKIINKLPKIKCLTKQTFDDQVPKDIKYITSTR